MVKRTRATQTPLAVIVVSWQIFHDRSLQFRVAACNGISKTFTVEPNTDMKEFRAKLIEIYGLRKQSEIHLLGPDQQLIVARGNTRLHNLFVL